MLKNYQAVLFDFDGTLAPNLNLKAMKRDLIALTVQQTSIDISEIEPLYMLELIDYTSDWLIAKEDSSKAYVKAAHDLIKQIEVDAAQTTQLFPSSKSLLIRIRFEGLKIGIVTRNCQAAVRTVFPDLDDYTDALFTREDVEHQKPDPRHLQTCLNAIKCDGAQSVMVGDSIMDMQVGKQLNMYCVGVLTGDHDKGALERSGAHRVLDSVADF